MGKGLLMKKRALGRTGLFVSTLGWGTVKLGRDQGVRYPTAFSLPDDAAARTLMGLVHDLGINLIDTAPAYGTSEQRLGGLLRDVTCEDRVVSTKVGEEFEHGVSIGAFTPEHARFSLARSRERLGVGVLDMVLIHSTGADVDILRHSGVVEVLLSARERGEIRGWGVSSKTVEGGLLAVKMGADAVMVAYNPWQREEEPVLDAAGMAGCSVLIKKALNSGHGADAMEESFRFLLAHPAVTSIVVGSITPAHLRANAAMIEQIEQSYG